jgi:exosortase family protein XrtF
MIFLQKIKTKFSEIPKQVYKFIGRAIIIFFIWKLLYHVFLFSNRTLDAPFTSFTAVGTAKILKVFYPSSDFSIKSHVKQFNQSDSSKVYSEIVYKETRPILSIADGCNALELIILFTGFILCIPMNIKRTAAYIFGGSLLLYLINILRCAVIGVLNISNNKLTDIAHHYLFKLIVYFIIFLLWKSYLQAFKHEEE